MQKGCFIVPLWKGQRSNLLAESISVAAVLLVGGVLREAKATNSSEQAVAVGQLTQLSHTCAPLQVCPAVLPKNLA